MTNDRYMAHEVARFLALEAKQSGEGVASSILTMEDGRRVTVFYGCEDRQRAIEATRRQLAVYGVRELACCSQPNQWFWTIIADNDSEEVRESLTGEINLRYLACIEAFEERGFM